MLTERLLICFLSGNGFWDKPLWIWDQNFNVGCRSHYVASALALKRMVPRGDGLVVNISSSGGLKWFNDVAYGVAKAAVDRMATDMAHELKILKTGQIIALARSPPLTAVSAPPAQPHPARVPPPGVTACSLWPGMVATEVVLGTGFFSKDMLESPRFTGRAVCALLAGSSAAQTWPLCQLAACAGAGCARGWMLVPGPRRRCRMPLPCLPLICCVAAPTRLFLVSVHCARVCDGTRTYHAVQTPSARSTRAGPCAWASSPRATGSRTWTAKRRRRR